MPAQPEKLGRHCRQLHHGKGHDPGGSVAAALRLVGIYRDGRRERGRVLVEKNVKLAQTHSEKTRDRLSPVIESYRQFLLDAATARNRDYPSPGTRFDGLTSTNKAYVLRDLHRVQSRLHVFLVQRELGRLGLNRGKATGKINDAMRLALACLCERTGTPCYRRHGPISSQVADLMARLYLAARRQGLTLISE